MILSYTDANTQELFEKNPTIYVPQTLDHWLYKQEYQGENTIQ